MGIMNSLGRGFKLLSDVLNEGIDFGKKEGKFISVVKYLVVSSLAMIAAFTMAAILGVVAYLLTEAGVTVWVLAPIALIALAFIVGGQIYSYAASFGAIQFIYSGKKRGYFESENVNIAFKWTLFMIGAFVGGILLILFLTLAPIFAIALGGEALAGASLLTPILGSLGVIAMFVGILFFLVFMYYSQQELAVKKRGPVGAIKASMEVVKGNFWETVLFALVVYFLSQVVMGIPMSMLSVGMQVGISILTLGGIAGMVAGVVLLLVFVVLMMAIAFVVEAGELILKVGFYKKLTGEKEALVPGAKPAVKKPEGIVVEERIG